MNTNEYDRVTHTRLHNQNRTTFVTDSTDKIAFTSVMIHLLAVQLLMQV